MAIIEKQKNRLIYRFDAEKVWIEPWGKNSLRIRATKCSEMPDEDWALLKVDQPEEDFEIEIVDLSVAAAKAASTLSLSDRVGSATGLAGAVAARMKNGKLTAEITANGKLTFYNEKGDI